MVIRARRDRRSHRFVEWQVALFFLAAGIWVGAMIAGQPKITGAGRGRWGTARPTAIGAGRVGTRTIQWTW